MKKRLTFFVKKAALGLLCLLLASSSVACGNDTSNTNILLDSSLTSLTSGNSDMSASSSKSDSSAKSDDKESVNEKSDADKSNSKKSSSKSSNSKTPSSKKSSSKKPSSEDSGYNDTDNEDLDYEEPDYEDSDYEEPDYEDPDYEEPDYEDPDYEDPDYEEPDYEDSEYDDSDSSDFTASESSSSSSRPALMWGDKPIGQIDSSKTSSLKPNNNYYGSTDFVISSDESKKSASPYITVAAQVADDLCVVAGVCAKNTTRIKVFGDRVTSTSVVPYAGKDNYYFIAQVKYKGATTLKFTAEEKGKSVSDTVTAKIGYEPMNQNYMERSDYSPVIGKNSRMHFYSALLAYSLNTDRVDNNMKQIAKENINSIVSAANKVGAETIFLVIPSSADIYSETVPDSYTKSSGQRLHEEFARIATDCGAKVIYPIDTMKKHRNDGTGYQLYQHTDSHWSTYGAYWGTYDLLNHIGKKFTAAKPRTVSQMGFYTAEMHAGDAVFNFPHRIGFENYYGDGTTNTTKLKELTTLYRRSMPTNTLKQVYNNYNGLYLTNDNAAAATVNNPSGSGLPTALIMRDSFGKVAYDMLNDRFKTVYWGEFDNYNLPTDIISTKKPDYVIYLYSERNLLKIMLNNSAANILNLK